MSNRPDWKAGDVAYVAAFSDASRMVVVREVVVRDVTDKTVTTDRCEATRFTTRHARDEFDAAFSTTRIGALCRLVEAGRASLR